MRLRPTVRAVLIMATLAGVVAPLAAQTQPAASATRQLSAAWASQPAVTPAGRHIMAPASGLTSIHMIDATQGWGLTSNAVLRTSDGGASWRNVTPSGFVVQGRSAAYFLDAGTAWVAATRRGSVQSVVLRTADSGRTWAAAPLAPAVGQQFAGIASISFIDAQYGWLLASLGAGAGSEGVQVFRTTDGGAHWVSVSLSAGVTATPGSLPLGGLKSGLAFRDASTGWATGVVYGPPGFTWLYITHDGGHTWSHQPLALPAAYRQGMPAANPPRFDTPLVGILPLTLFGTGGQPAADFYMTRDGGRTWASGTPLPYTSGNTGFSWDFVGADHGWAAWGRKLHYTTDGGRHWAVIVPNVSLANVTELDFVGAHTGWALGSITHGAVTSAFLLATVDAGRTWNTVIRAA